MEKIIFYRPPKPEPTPSTDFDGNSFSYRSSPEITVVPKEKHTIYIDKIIEIPVSNLELSPINLDISRDHVLTPKFKFKIKIEKNCKKNKKKKKNKENGRTKLSDKKNSLFASIQRTDGKHGLLNFFLIKLLFPILFFTILILGLILLQIYIEDFCFYPSLCRCQSLGVFAYTMLREFFQFDALLIVWFYFLTGYLTGNFFQKKYLRVFFFVLMFSGFITFFGISFFQRNEEILANMRINRSYITLLLTLFYVFVIAAIFRQISKNFLTKLFIISCFSGYYFFHGLYLKNTLSYYFLFYLQRNFDYPLNIYLFKLFLLIYYVFYTNIAKSLIFHFYKKILSEGNDNSMDMIIALTKFINIDVLSIKVMNVLTIPLDEIYSWISLGNYLYSMISVYLDINIRKIIFRKIWRKFFTKNNIQKERTEEEKNYDSLRGGCILEANIIIFVRVMIHHYFNYFFYITKVGLLYSGCSLEASSLNFTFFIKNIILIFCSHFGLVFLIVIYMIRTKKSLIDLVVENFSLIFRGMLFIIYYTQVDVCIQFYTLLEISR